MGGLERAKFIQQQLSLKIIQRWDDQEGLVRISYQPTLYYVASAGLFFWGEVYQLLKLLSDLI